MHGRFSSASINAFNDRWLFHAEPILTLVVFAESRLLKEKLRFGFDTTTIPYYELWRKKRVSPNGEHYPKLVDAPLNWEADRWGLRNDFGSRYVAVTTHGGRWQQYFYMDRVI